MAAARQKALVRAVVVTLGRIFLAGLELATACAIALPRRRSHRHRPALKRIATLR